MTDQTLSEAFNRYLASRFAQADAITPGQKLEVIRNLRKETHEQGRVPLPGGPVRVDVHNEAVHAALSGRAVSVGGQAVKAKSASATSAEGLAGLNPAKKAVILVGILLIPLLLFVLFLMAKGGGEGDVARGTAVPGEETPNILISSVEDVAISTPTPTDLPPTATPVPTIQPTLPAPEIIIVTPTRFPALQINERGSVAGEGNDPASLEVAGFAYILTTGSVSNGLWEPRGAEWLQGTSLRRVITVPYDMELLQALFTMPAKEHIRLRLRSGEIVDYELAEVARVSQTEIEVLSAPFPSIAIILHSEEETDTRWVVIGKAIQEEGDFQEYGAGITAISSKETPSDFIQVNEPTYAIDDLTLTIEECAEVEEIDGKTPPGSNQRFVSCDVVLEALTKASTQEDLAITEQAWAASAAGWLPFQTVYTNQLEAGDVLNLTVSGVVNQSSELVSASQPVLMWRRADATYLFSLSIFE